MSTKSIEIKPHKDLKHFTCKQSKYENVPTLPCSMLILAPSNSGKTILLTSLIENIYRSCFERVYIFSPSIEVDSSWLSTKKFQSEIMKVDDKNEQLYFDTYDEEALANIIDTQHKVILKMKETNARKLYSIAVIIDDMADDRKVGHSKVLNSLYTRCRHNMISVFLSSQKLRTSISPIIRSNATTYIIYRIRNEKELQSIIEEISGLTSKKDTYDIYSLATKDDYSFLYVNLKSKNLNEIFYKNFSERITITED